MMQSRLAKFKIRLALGAALLAGALLSADRAAAQAAAAPLKIGYSDWPGWVAWEIPIQKGWFKDAGVSVEFTWMDYTASMDAYTAGKLDANCMTNGDAMVTGGAGKGKASKGILINDYSNGNDMVVAKAGIETFKDLKGKKIGVETGVVDHLLLLKALELNGMTEADVTLVNTKTDQTPQALASGQVDAIAAWQPNSGKALSGSAGSKPVFTSKDAPGLIYDLLYVSNESLSSRRADWKKVVQIWFKTVEYMKDPANKEEMLKILSARVGLKAEEYSSLLAGTAIRDLDQNVAIYKKGPGFDSVYGSSTVVNDFNVKNKVYDKSQDVDSYLFPDLVMEVAAEKGAAPAKSTTTTTATMTSTTTPGGTTTTGSVTSTTTTTGTMPAK